MIQADFSQHLIFQFCHRVGNLVFGCCDTCSHTSNARNKNFETPCQAEGLGMDTKPTDCCCCFSGEQKEIPAQISQLRVTEKSRGNRELKFSMIGMGWGNFCSPPDPSSIQHRSPGKI